MTIDHQASRASGRKQRSVNAASRRSFLRAGAAAGGGLMLSLSLPFAIGEAEAAETFTPNAFVASHVTARSS
jgi:isoquinoline 1-oxidoreductase beta subunit